MKYEYKRFYSEQVRFENKTPAHLGDLFQEDLNH